MTIQLRPHHLLCILTYVGKGYSPIFTANLKMIAGRLAEGEEIMIVEGPDDICAPLLADPDPHCLRCSVTERDRAAARAICKLLAHPVRSGDRLVLDQNLLRRLREAFSAKHIRAACDGCEWNDFCGSIASDGYAGAILFPSTS
jgi:hypothetical protein